MSQNSPDHDDADAPLAIDRTTDAYFLALGANAEPPAHAELAEQLRALDCSVFPFDAGELVGDYTTFREELRFLDALGAIDTDGLYYDDRDPRPIELTPKGEQIVARLRAGLDDDHAAAIREVFDA